MLAYKNVYSLQEGKLIKNKENKIEYTDESGKRRVKTNPTYADFAKVGKYPLKEDGQSGLSPARGNVAEQQRGCALSKGAVPTGDGVSYVIEDGYIVPVYATMG